MVEIIAALAVIGKIVEAIMKDYGLWQTVLACILLFSVPILIWKLDVIIAAIKS
ncbi:hypothetical protein [Acinetobacter sp. Ac_3412]|uniref:hypothetical protein n=1 Tax=Acinetobacter sp. Ac_3412 TaxID=1848935 RepID=UPI00148FBB02|nr:hypothetical protein [Acinetobacter sp. Ac_3412]